MATRLVLFRQSLYLMVLAFSRFARPAARRSDARWNFTGSQFAVLIGTAYRQGRDGVSIRDLADHIALAATHVTTEVGRLIDKGLLVKTANRQDRRGVLVHLSLQGQDAVRAVAPFVRRVNDRPVCRRFAPRLRRGVGLPVAVCRQQAKDLALDENSAAPGARSHP